MPSNNQKTPLVDGFNRFVSAKLEDAAALTGKSLPASVIAVDPTSTVVTVKFEVKTNLQIPMVQCPIGFPEYVRFPIKNGDKGFVVAVDAYMGGMSGLGGGLATLAQQPNLATLVWFPCGNLNFDALEDEEKNKFLAYGPKGVYLRDTERQIEFILDPDTGLIVKWHGQTLMSVNNAGVQLAFNGFGIVINSEGTHVDGINFLPHEHKNVQSGSDNTGPVQTP